jgi:hypothetical protein
MSEEVDWREVRALLETLYQQTDRLEALFPGRKFTLDGHLVGSIGEVLGAYMFDLELHRGSNKVHDAQTRSGGNVEIKLTQGDTIAIRHPPEHLLVFQRKKESKLSVVFNGPGKLAWDNAGKMQSNGQRPISLQKLHKLNQSLDPDTRLKQSREAPI